MPLTDGLITVHNALVGTGLRDRIRIGASGKVRHRHRHRQADRPGRRLHQRGPGDDDGASAASRPRGATPTSARSASPPRTRAGPARSTCPTRAERVQPLPAGHRRPGPADDRVDGADRAGRAAPRRCCAAGSTTRRRATYAELYDWLAPGELLAEPPADWAGDWAAADPDRFRRRPHPRSDRYDHRRRADRRPRSPITAYAPSGASSATRSTRSPTRSAARTASSGSACGTRRSRAFAAGAQAQLTGTARRLHGHGRAGLDPPAQRPVRREEVARAGAGDLRAGAAGRARQRLLPGGRQRPAVPRRRGVHAARHRADAAAPRCSSRRSRPRYAGPGSRC